MKLITKQPINFNTWIDQIKRFSNIEDLATNTRFPINTENPKKVNVLIAGQAEIIVEQLKPINQGFKADVSYIQNYFTKKNVPTFDDNNVQNGTKETTTKNSIVVIKYTLFKTVKETHELLENFENLINKDLTGLNRFNQLLGMAFINDVVSKFTFNSLTENDYELVID